MSNVVTLFAYTNIVLVAILTICQVPLNKSLFYMATALAMQIVYLLTLL